MEFVVGLKWSALRTEVDPLTGEALVLPGRHGLDPASAAALEWALRLAAPVGARVAALTVGPEEADAALRAALSLGAATATRVPAPPAGDSRDVAAALADAASGADLVVTGSWSVDGRSASVAPTLAALLDRAQGCGLLAVDWDGDALVGERRLPAGRRERIRLALPAVISMEAGTIPGRRASLTALLAASTAEVTVAAPSRPVRPAAAGTVAAYRPRPRTVPPAPAGDDPRRRIAALTGALDALPPSQQIVAEPEEAAAEIVAALRRRGYLGG